MGIASRIANLFSAEVKAGPRPDKITQLPITTGAEGNLHIPMPDPTAEDRARDEWQQLGQRLARQDDWSTLSVELRKADTARAMTPGGMSVAELIAFGARSDVIGAVEHAFFDGVPEPDAPLLDGIEALEAVLHENEHDHGIALVVALAHMDIAWIWRGGQAPAAQSSKNLEAFDAHMERARDILSEFCGKSLGAPLIMAASCGLTLPAPGSLGSLIKRFETLIEMSPMDTRQMRNFGLRLLPSRDGGYDELELNARRTASTLHHIWGSGGYTWMMFDAISHDDEALAGLDVTHFVQGLRDILALRPDQYTVNLLGAYCAITMGGETGHEVADLNRAHIHKCRDWIVTDYMTELHPLIWAHATHGFDNNLAIRSVDGFADKGRTEAHRILNALFLPELARGQDVVFSENGPAIRVSG